MTGLIYGFIIAAIGGITSAYIDTQMVPGQNKHASFFYIFGMVIGTLITNVIRN